MAETTEVRISTEGGWNCSVKAPWHDSGGYLQTHEDVALQEARHLRVGASVTVLLTNGAGAEESRVYRVMKIAGLTAVKRIDGQRGNYTG